MKLIKIASFLTAIPLLIPTTACDEEGPASDSGTDSDNDPPGEDSETSGDTSSSPGNTCDGGILDDLNQICWETPEGAGELDYYNAPSYCDTLSKEGHADWRLPTIEEFMDILEHCEENEVFGDWHCANCYTDRCEAIFGEGATATYWSSSVEDNQAWYANMMGYVELTTFNVEANVRCVRDL